MTEANETAKQGAFYCDGCSLIPLDQLGLEPPTEGWRAVIERRGYEIIPDHIGRPSIVRVLAATLHRERAEAKARADEKRRSLVEYDQSRFLAKVQSLKEQRAAAQAEANIIGRGERGRGERWLTR